MPLYHQDPKRFMRFYDIVYLKLCSIPEGGTLRIDEHCKPKAIDTFIKIASLLIIEEACRKKVTDDLLELSDDHSAIRRCRKFIPSRPYRRGIKGI